MSQDRALNPELEPDVIAAAYKNLRGAPARSGALISSRDVGKGGLKFMGYTESAGVPTVVSFPENNSWGFHQDTTGPTVYLVFNLAGALKSVALA